MNSSYDLIVVGGGASGLMAAGRAASRGLRVLLLEKNKRLGEKLRISGGGRCNITNAEEDERVLLKKYGKAEQFLYSLFTQFGVKSTFSFFESRNLPLVVEPGKRAFPKTEKAEDVVRVLEAYIKKSGVEVRTNCPVTKVVTKNGAIASVQCGSEQFGDAHCRQFTATDYLFATGGVSHPETGSTGDGFKWLETLGHTVAEPTPTLVPLAIKEQWVKDLSGVSLDPMKITFFADMPSELDESSDGGKKPFGSACPERSRRTHRKQFGSAHRKQFSLEGKILFTHFGISGPLILNSSYKVADLLHTGVVTATIDAYPRTDLGALEKKLLAVFDANKNKTLKNIIKDIVPDGMQRGIVTLIAGRMDVMTKVHSVTKEDRKRIVRLLKELPVMIEGLMGFDRSIVADGGLPLEEIDMKTMRSKIVPNLLVTGDLLNINRPSGGYSLQLCWSTGYVAGEHARKAGNE